jgi:hypothetical protein
MVHNTLGRNPVIYSSTLDADQGAIFVEKKVTKAKWDK